MNDLDNFYDKVKNRILNNYLLHSKNKLSKWNKYSPFLLALFPLGVYMFYYLLTSPHYRYNMHISALFIILIGSLFTASPFIYFATNFGGRESYTEGFNPYTTKASLIDYFKGYLNYEKAKNVYFNTLPDNYSLAELKQYLINKSDVFFHNRPIKLSEIEQVFLLTTEEQEALKKLNLTEFQKNLLIDRKRTLGLTDIEEATTFTNSQAKQALKHLK